MGILDRFKKLFEPVQKLDVGTRFVLEQTSITGTMSKFRVAREIKTGRVMGLKFLDSEKTDHFNSRFKGLNKPSEGEIAMQIVHRNVVKTFEYGITTNNQHYILMEYIDGKGVNTLIKERNPKMIENRMKLIRQMCNALQAVHDAGFIHRDVCPRNFIATTKVNELKLIDFGLTVPNQPEFRQPGNRTGTPQYMAPEIVRRRSTDIRVDVFALGVTVYRMLAFEHPWGSTETTGLAALAHDTRPATSIAVHRPNLHPNLIKAVDRCLEKEPDKRPKTVKHFLSLIKEVKEEEV